MKVKLIKDSPTHKKGEIVSDIDPVFMTALVALQFAEIVDENAKPVTSKPKQPRKTTAKKTTKTEDK